MDTLIKQICRLLEEGRPLVLATITGHSGSTPRGAGAKMVVCDDGTVLGTIGGGAVEAAVIRRASGLMTSSGAIFCHFDFSTTATAGAMGMICGGDMDVLLERLDPLDSVVMDIFSTLCSKIETGEKALLLKAMSPKGEVSEVYHTGLVCDDVTFPEGFFENIPLDVEVLEALKETAYSRRAPVIHTEDGLTLLADPFFSSDGVYLFGAGHVSQKLAEVLDMVGFKTTIIDDRREFANRTFFPAADTILTPEHFPAAFPQLTVSRRDALVIITRGHAHDQSVLEQALHTDAGYIGMIGSKKKRDAIYNNLSIKGVPREVLDRVHCPIGIDIGARTPEEIAVCIAAQLISYRAGRI